MQRKEGGIDFLSTIQIDAAGLGEVFKMFNIAFVDEDRVALAALAARVSENSDITVSFRSTDVPEAISTIAAARPDLVIADVVSAAMDPYWVVRGLRGAVEDALIVVVTNELSDRLLLDVFQAGAQGFVVKDRAMFALPNAVLAVLGGGKYIDPSVTRRFVEMAWKERNFGQAPDDLPTEPF